MNWLDYRNKLGLGFADKEKYEMLSNKVNNFILNVVGNAYSKEAYLEYCMMTGVKCCSYDEPYINVARNIEKSDSMSELVSKYVAFYNTYKIDHNYYSYYDYGSKSTSKKDVIDFLEKALEDLNVSFEIIKDKDGIFIFPKSAEEFDDALISEPLEWLTDYPDARKTYVIALKQYSEGKYVRDVADNLRKALETFLQEFLGNTKNLESNKVEIGRYLANQNIDAGVVGFYKSLLSTYKSLNDKIAKHNDAVDEKMLEFLVYQTGIFIRMLIVINNKHN